MPYVVETQLPFNAVSNAKAGKYPFIFKSARKIKDDVNGNPVEVATGLFGKDKQPGSCLIQRYDLTAPKPELVEDTTYDCIVAISDKGYGRGVLPV